MTTEEVLDYFGSGHKACEALDIAWQNFTHWKRNGYIPVVQQLKIEKLTAGKLTVTLQNTPKLTRKPTHRELQKLNKLKKDTK